MLDGKIQSAPKINSEIPGGKGVITTGDQKASQDLVNLLKSGALPVDIKILETRTIGASLGVESIKQTQLAGIIAIILISIFMIAIYKIQCNYNITWYCWIYIISRNGSRCKCYYF